MGKHKLSKYQNNMFPYKVRSFFPLFYQTMLRLRSILLFCEQEFYYTLSFIIYPRLVIPFRFVIFISFTLFYFRDESFFFFFFFWYFNHLSLVKCNKNKQEEISDIWLLTNVFFATLKREKEKHILSVWFI